jgi:hypothetical protein
MLLPLLNRLKAGFARRPAPVPEPLASAAARRRATAEHDYLGAIVVALRKNRLRRPLKQLHGN